MSHIRSKGTSLETAFLKVISAELYPRGYRYRKHYNKLVGKPDIVFVRYKLAIFLDGDFWHGRDFANERKRLPKEYWRKKIQNNIERDIRVNKELRKLGWKVLRFWEGEIKKNPQKAIKRIVRYL